jgi:hypothetical protein
MKKKTPNLEFKYNIENNVVTMRLYKNGDWKQKKIFGNYIGFVWTKLKVPTHWKLDLISLNKNAIKQPLNLTMCFMPK